jgi:DNA-binding MarR family transcriptional regulator
MKMPPDLSTPRPDKKMSDTARTSSDRELFTQRLLTQVAVGRRCQRAMLAALQEVQLTDTQLLVLWGIDQLSPSVAGGGVAQSEVAQSLGISPAQVSGLVEQLRRQADLDSRRAPYDRRQQLWQLTDLGCERLQLALQQLANLDAGLLDWPDIAEAVQNTGQPVQDTATVSQPAGPASSSAGSLPPRKLPETPTGTSLLQGEAA